jgi:hypothetical protein
MVVIGQPCQQRLKHPRRRRKTVQQQNRRRILGACFAIEDVEAIDLHCPIKDLLLHCLVCLVLWLGIDVRGGREHDRRGRKGHQAPKD